MALRSALSIALVFTLLGGCGVRSLGGDSSGIGDSSAGEAPASCPAAGAATLVSCEERDRGASCGGTTTCACGGRFVQVKTSCSCQDDGYGTSWACNDDCTQACVHPTVDGPPPSTQGICFAFVQALDVCAGVDPDLSDVRARCAKDETNCGAGFDALMSCVARRGIACTNGATRINGCDAELAAVSSCDAP